MFRYRSQSTQNLLWGSIFSSSFFYIERKIKLETMTQTWNGTKYKYMYKKDPPPHCCHTRNSIPVISAKKQKSITLLLPILPEPTAPGDSTEEISPLFLWIVHIQCFHRVLIPLCVVIPNLRKAFFVFPGHTCSPMSPSQPRLQQTN